MYSNTEMIPTLQEIGGAEPWKLALCAFLSLGTLASQRQGGSFRNYALESTGLPQLNFLGLKLYSSYVQLIASYLKIVNKGFSDYILC